MIKPKDTLALVAVLAAMIPAGAQAAAHKSPVLVFKSPYCGCCEAWATALRQDGYDVEIRNMEDLSRIKQMAGVSTALEACHTAVIGDAKKYVLEGHVPLAAIARLTAEQPDIRGLAVPGMPQGSLGMGGGVSDYTVYAFTGDGADAPTTFFRP